MHDVEEWLPVVGFERYEVSNWGRVRSWRRKGFGAGRIRSKPLYLRHYITKQGYARVALRHAGTYRGMVIHRLVLEAFVGSCPLDHECAHSECDIHEIRAAGEPSHVVAGRFGVASATIRKIRRGEAWRHVS